MKAPYLHYSFFKKVTLGLNPMVKNEIEYDDIEKLIDNMHFEAQDCFEKMITDELRSEMNKED